MVLPLNRMRFWSALPPRTLKPPDASPTLLTPGRVRTALMTSPSPKADGILFIVFTLTFSTPISVFRCWAMLSAETTASLSIVTFSVITTFRPPSERTTTRRARSSLPSALKFRTFSPPGRLRV